MIAAKAAKKYRNALKELAKQVMKEPRWVNRIVLDAVHIDQLREHGGLPGIRDENALESALSRARNKRDTARTSISPIWQRRMGSGYRRVIPKEAFPVAPGPYAIALAKIYRTI